MKSIYTQHLEGNGWTRVGQMTFVLDLESRIEFFFDTSNQIEVYTNGTRRISRTLHDLDDLKEVLKEIPLIGGSVQ